MCNQDVSTRFFNIAFTYLLNLYLNMIEKKHRGFNAKRGVDAGWAEALKMGYQVIKLMKERSVAVPVNVD